MLDARDLVYTTDASNSGMDPAVALPGWRLKDSHAEAGATTHPTTFGDPSLNGGDSTYASMKLVVGVERAHVANFIKATFSVYIATLLALIGLLVIDGRPGMLGGSMFAVVLSFVFSWTGSSGHMTAPICSTRSISWPWGSYWWPPPMA